MKDNYSEINDMEKLVKKYGLEYHIYDKISPGLSGSSKPLSCAAECVNLFSSNKEKRECHAGKKFFHINSLGKASICKIARNPNFDIFAHSQEDLLDNLHASSAFLLKKPEMCIGCDNSQCQTCPPLLELYKKAGYVPAHICQKGGDF